jgi:hypothetical protein
VDWRAGIVSETLRQSPVVQRLHSVDAVARTLDEQDKMLGRGLFLPPEGSEGTVEHAEAMSKVYTKLGRPNAAADYTLKAPEGIEMDKTIQERWQNAFHGAGLSQKQVDEVMAEYWRTVEYADNVRQGQDQRSRIEGQRALDAEFGASAPMILNKARAFFQHFGAGAFGGEGGEKAAADLEEAALSDGSRLLNRPWVISALAEAFDRLGEGQFLDSVDYRPGGNTLETITQRHRELTGKKLNRTASPDELAEIQRLAEQLVRLREREGRGSRVA